MVKNDKIKHVINMTGTLFNFKHSKMKKLLFLTLTLALLSMLFVSIPQSFAADPVGASYAVGGRRLSAASAGDTSDWIEIAQYTNTAGISYSLIVRTNYINIYTQASRYGDPAWQYVDYGASSAYGSSFVRDKINAWFNGVASGAADNLPANARLRGYTMQNNAVNVLGTASNVVSLTNGFSQPTYYQVGVGNDVAFALSYSESAAFLSKTHDVRGLNPQMQPSSALAVANYGKITIPATSVYGMWLRSPGDVSITAGVLDHTGRAFQYHTSPSYGEYGLVYPALWVNSSIFDVGYTVHYYLEGTTTKLANDKIVTGQAIGSSVTEHAIDVAGYTAIAPTSVSKTLSASGNEFVFYYSVRSDLSYVVNYLEQGTNRVLAQQKVVGGQVFGAQVTEAAVDIAGYNKVAPTSVTITVGMSGNVITFYYTTANDVMIGSIRKTVAGIAFDEWATGYGGGVAELVSGINFKLYMVNADGTINYADIVANGVLTANGIIDFNTPLLSAGRYAIIETLTGKAAEVFAATTPLYIYISENGDVIEDFDYSSDYFVSWNWFNAEGRVGLTGVPVGYYYMIEVWNIKTRTTFGADYKAYASFCAGGTSRTFAETESYVVGQLNQETYDKILAALNYIYNKYGSVDAWQGNTGPITVEQSTKVLSQMVVWTLLHDDVALQGMRVAEAGYDADEFARALQDVIDNSVGSSGAVKSLVYLVGSNFPSDIVSHQPQIVPLFGDPVFNNVLNNC
ncbi:MAG: hypothetical protein LBC12_03685 [Nitrososphaerota archaeon]|jgi:hypothetical protein|nr:hypothetical protein [Nitrososphaerota archaeon]